MNALHIYHVKSVDNTGREIEEEGNMQANLKILIRFVNMYPFNTTINGKNAFNLCRVRKERKRQRERDGALTQSVGPPPRFLRLCKKDAPNEGPLSALLCVFFTACLDGC